MQTKRQYKKAIQKGSTKRQYKKAIKIKKKMVGGAIEEGDIMYRDDLVCILKPEIKKGIIIWTNYTQPQDMESLCEIGLKTGKQMKEEGINFGRSIYHPYIFFRAPYYNNPIDYTDITTEIKSLYGDMDDSNYIFIRVDPDNTYVFSSEIRATAEYHEKNDTMIQYSKKTLSEYLQIISDNKKIEENIPKDQKILYNLFSSEATLFPIRTYPEPPFNEHPINKHSEILVSKPHLTKEYFVLCTRETKSQQAADRKKKIDENHFIPIILENPKRYQCPICKNITGTLAPQYPRNTSLFAHDLWCPFKGKIPVEKQINNS
jgi:hypothetical protein